MKLATAVFLALTLMGYAADAVVESPPTGDGLDPCQELSTALGWGHRAAGNLTTQCITVDSLSSGAVEAVYQSPNKGRVSLNLLNSNNDTLIHVDARFDWYGWMSILVLNSKTANGGWQEEAHPEGFPFHATTITLRVEIGDEAFVISANGIEIAKYPYHDDLHPPVNQIVYVFEDTGASVKANLESLSVDRDIGDSGGQKFHVPHFYLIGLYAVIVCRL